MIGFIKATVCLCLAVLLGLALHRVRSGRGYALEYEVSSVRLIVSWLAFVAFILVISKGVY